MLAGTARADRINKQEPKALEGKAKPPTWLRGKGRIAWSWLAPMLEEIKVLTPAHEQALGFLCDAMADYIEARAIVRAEGRTYVTYTETGSKMIRPHPEIANAADAWRRVQRMLVEFGLTPSSQSKVKAGEPEEKDPFEEFLKRGNN